MAWPSTSPLLQEPSRSQCSSSPPSSSSSSASLPIPRTAFHPVIGHFSIPPNPPADFSVTNPMDCSTTTPSIPASCATTHSSPSHFLVSSCFFTYTSPSL
ncbi:unnamed protein product [Cuscuta europaea]|uniref:Uncharacterized protein n=1 Tax=Cuscuta europaea TaxID=41803 RepID=A0A9P1EJW8_CUSEU|nr:unnamed protein product [Cuscuta europaea]